MDSYRWWGVALIIAGAVLCAIGLGATDETVKLLKWAGLVVALLGGLPLLILGETWKNIFRYVGGTTGPGENHNR